MAWKTNGGTSGSDPTYLEPRVSAVEVKTNNMAKIPNKQTWIATEGQTDFTISNGSISNVNLLDVYVGGVPQDEIILVNPTTFRFSEALSVGMKVYAEWFEVEIPIGQTHKSTHEKNGANEIDITKLKNYDVITSQLAEKASKKDLDVIVTDYGLKGDGLTDNTSAYLDMAATLEEGSTLIFPKGTFIINGLVMTKCFNIKGHSQKLTTIKNNSINPTIRINPTTMNSHRYFIKDITIQGNGTALYGTDATTGHGIQIDNSPYWDLENIRIVYHGGHGLYIAKDKWSWSHSFKNSFIGYNKLDGINCIATTGGTQKNDIDIINCSISKNGESGINIWAVKVNIFQNSIDGNKKYGVKVDRDEVSASYSIDGFNIENNYFETNKRGHLRFSTGYATYNNVVRGLIIKGNYFYSSSADLDVDVTSVISFVFTPVDRATPSIRDLYFGKNSFYFASLPTVSLVDFGNGLGKDSVIVNHYDSTKIVNAYGALLQGTRKISVSGYLESRGVQWDAIEKSNDVPTGTKIYFPLKLHEKSTLYGIGIPVFTDSTNYHVEIRVFTRSLNSNQAYTQTYNCAGYNKSGDYILTGLPTTANIADADGIVEVKITRLTVGTYLNIGNLWYEYV